MITVTSRSETDPSWDVRADQRFVEQYRDARKNAGSNFESNVKSKIDRICEHPLDGDRKGGRLKGLRGLHIEHLVALWEVTPEVASRKYADRVNDVYLVAIVHHDDYHRSLVNRQPAEPHREFTVAMRGENTANRHLVYDIDGVSVEGETWFNRKGTDGVILHGTYGEGRASAFDEQLPVGTGVSTAMKVAQDIDIGIKRRRIIDPDRSDSQSESTGAELTA